MLVEGPLTNVKPCVISIPRPRRSQNRELLRHTPLPPLYSTMGGSTLDHGFHPPPDRPQASLPIPTTAATTNGPGLIGDGRLNPNTSSAPNQTSSVAVAAPSPAQAAMASRRRSHPPPSPPYLCHHTPQAPPCSTRMSALRACCVRPNAHGCTLLFSYRCRHSVDRCNCHRF